MYNLLVDENYIYHSLISRMMKQKDQIQDNKPNFENNLGTLFYMNSCRCLTTNLITFE